MANARSELRAALRALALTLLSASAALAQSAAAPAAVAARPVFTVARTVAVPKIDGQLDDATWQGAPTLALGYETRPGENIPAKIRTDVWITYDQHALYVAFRAEDPEPAKIRARYTDRDKAFQDDFVGVVLDTFGDRRRGFEFFVNPLGVQMDLVQNEITGSEDDTWDAIWQSAGRLTPAGYEVEIAIPLQALRFPDTKDVQTWGIDVLRVWPRESRYQFTAAPRERGRNCYLCQIVEITGIEGISPGRDFELDPTVTANRTDVRPAGGDALDTGDVETEGGLSVRWGITPNLVANAAVNPDFSQVEADSARLSVNTQFAIFYPEKRPFFLEGADLFETKLGVVYTRDIADPSWGVKLTGKVGDHALGLVAARDDVTNVLVPGAELSGLGSIDTANTSAIARYRHDLGASSTIGVIATGRQGDGYENGVAGVDALFRWKERYAFRVEAFGSQTDYPAEFAAAFGQRADAFADHGIRLGFSRSTREWYYAAVAKDMGDGFRADLGFVPQVGIRQGETLLERHFYNPPGSTITEWTIAARGLATERRDGGDLLERQAEVYAYGNGPWQSYGEVHAVAGRRGFDGEIFDDRYVTVYLEARPTGLLSFTLEGRTGDQVDFENVRQGRGTRIAPGLRLEPGRHLRLQLSHDHQTLDADGGRVFTAQVSELRATYQFNLRTFVRLVSQYFDVERDPSLYGFPVERRNQDLLNQLLLSYKLNPQTVLFLGYSDAAAGDERVDLARQSRTLFFKVGYAWQV